MDYSKKIKEIRNALGLSQTEAGKRVGLTGPHISRLEQGKTPVSDFVLEKYVNAFGVDEVWLHSDDESQVRFDENMASAAMGVVARIKEIRLALGMSQSKFAEFTGLKLTNVCNIEAGKALPGIVSLKRVSETCNVGLEWLQYGDDSKKEFPVNDKLVDWLWKHKDVREMLYEKMEEPQ